MTDFIPPERALHGYRLVILPSTVMVSAGFATRLSDFVSAGGVVLAIGQVGIRDPNNNYLPYPGPDHLLIFRDQHRRRYVPGELSCSRDRLVGSSAKEGPGEVKVSEICRVSH
jgi:beta-galactosidase GanA